MQRRMLMMMAVMLIATTDTSDDDYDDGNEMMIATVNVVVLIVLCMLVLPCGRFLFLHISLMFVLICLLVESLLGYGFCCISASKILSDR